MQRRYQTGTSASARCTYPHDHTTELTHPYVTLGRPHRPGAYLMRRSLNSAVGSRPRSLGQNYPNVGTGPVIIAEALASQNYDVKIHAARRPDQEPARLPRGEVRLVPATPSYVWLAGAGRVVAPSRNRVPRRPTLRRRNRLGYRPRSQCLVALAAAGRRP